MTEKQGGSYVVQPDGGVTRVEWTEPSDAGPREAPPQAPSKPPEATRKEA